MTSRSMSRIQTVWDEAAGRIAKGESEVAVLACLLVGIVVRMQEIGGREQALESLAMVERSVKTDCANRALN